MPRKRKPARLWLDPKRKQWVIRDGDEFVRTGCAEAELSQAERELAHHVSKKHKPEPSIDPLLDEVLLAYSSEHLPKTRGRKNARWHIETLLKFWGGKRVSEINATACRAYFADRQPAGARRDLELLRAAVRYWHNQYGPLKAIPSFVLPDKSGSRERWLTTDEAKRLRKAAMRWPHLYRFIILGLLTGSRAGVLFKLQWSWIDLEHRIMRRRAPGEREDKRKKTPPVKFRPALARLLRCWRRRDGEGAKYVVHFHGRPIYRIKRTWNQARKLADLGSDVTPHTLRHTRATWLMQSGKVDAWEAAGHLGMSVEMLQRVYGHHHPDYQGEAPEV